MAALLSSIVDIASAMFTECSQQLKNLIVMM
jgi:hypothetical protein